MNKIYQAALEIQQFLESQNWQFCIIGALSLLRWGEARMTQNVDIALLTGFPNEKEFIQKILDRFSGRIEEAKEELEILDCLAKIKAEIKAKLGY